MKEDKKQRVAQTTTAPAAAAPSAPESARPVKVAKKKKLEEKTESQAPPTSVTSSRKQVQEPATQAIPSAPVSSLLSMDEIFTLAAEADWSAKVTGFDNLNKKLETAHHEVGSKQGKVLELLIDSLSEKVHTLLTFFLSFELANLLLLLLLLSSTFACCNAC